ncbi:MAG TPA: hypothetical protein VK826_07040, partial [Bacteroidia bacterium]|nr:hypothetical protein [Bacteroidia bacterium]
VHDGKLYCVGNFEKIGGVDALGLASWDGNFWCGYDTHFDFSAPNEFVGAVNIAFSETPCMWVADFNIWIRCRLITLQDGLAGILLIRAGLR